MAELLDGGFVITGWSHSYGPSIAALVVKFDSNGDLAWARSVSTTDYCGANGISATADGGLIVAGYANQSSTNLDLLLLKFDSGGNLEWGKTSAVVGQELVHAIRQTSDGGYILTGEDGSGLLLAKLDANANVEWLKNIDGPSLHSDLGYDVIQSMDGGYAVVGIENAESSSGHSNIFLVKCDDLGTVSWSRSIEQPGPNAQDVGRGIRQTADGGYVIGGWTYPTNNSEEALLLKTDDSGELVWAKVVQGPDLNFGYAIDLACDGGLILAGTSTSFDPEYDSQALLLKTDAAGMVPGCQYIADVTLVSNEIAVTVTQPASVLSSPSVSVDSPSVVVTDPTPPVEFLCNALATISASITCVPVIGTVPFFEQITVTMTNLYTEQVRRMAARIDLEVANGMYFPNWRRGWSNFSPGEVFSTMFGLSMPAVGPIIGDNIFTLRADDVTPAPYNRPPYPPAGDTDTDACTVVANAP